MASFRELKRDFGFKYACREAGGTLMWYWPNLIVWFKELLDESEPRSGTKK